MPERALRVLVLNQIAAAGLARLPAQRYLVGPALADPDAILLRSADLHGREIPASVVAVARAGAGTNNIPVEALSERGVPVFNTPGANANAVKELVLAGLLLAARRLPEALRFVDGLVPGPAMAQAVEDGKKAFAGRELAGQTLAVIGLGRIGCLVADAALRLGMQVTGYDPEITVDAAWSLPAQVRRARSVGEALRGAAFVTLHVPLLEATRHLIAADTLALLPAGAVLLNFSRDAVVDDAAVIAALDGGALGRYVCDFPSPALHGHAGVIALPHLGASTQEAEEHCAVMAAEQLRDFLEHGQVSNAVNLPSVAMARESRWRIAVVHANLPNMLAQISAALAAGGLNIHNMVNKSRGGMAYSLVDVDTPASAAALAGIAAIDGVRSVRDLPEGP